MTRASDFLFSLQNRGVTLWVADGRLHYRAPAGVLSIEQIEQLKFFRGEIIGSLPHSPRGHVNLRPTIRDPEDRIPLTFSQQWMWDELLLASEPSTRTQVIARRLHGHLNEGALQHAFAQLSAQHEALRTRFLVRGGIPEQIIDATSGSLAVVDLSGSTAAEREAEAMRRAVALVDEPINLAAGPLFAAELLKLSDEEYVLIVVMDHMISDGASIGIFLRDIWTIYAELVGGSPPARPVIQVQFADYAVWQSKTSDFRLQRHADYWRRRLTGAQFVQLYPLQVPRDRERLRIAVSPIRVGRALSEEVRLLCRRVHSTLTLVALSAYSLALMLSADTRDVTVSFISNGRQYSEVKNTIGYFAVPLFLRVGLTAQDRFGDVLACVKREYLAACDHADDGSIAAQIPRREFVANPRFNWIPSEFNLEPGECGESSGVSGIKQTKFEMALRDDIPRGGDFELFLSDTREGIAGAVWYRADLIPSSTLKRFERDFLFFTEKLVREPESLVMAGS